MDFEGKIHQLFGSKLLVSTLKDTRKKISMIDRKTHIKFFLIALTLHTTQKASIGEYWWMVIVNHQSNVALACTFLRVFFSSSLLKSYFHSFTVSICY